MPENTIDTLELEIKSNSQSAAKSLDELSKKLYSLSRAFGFVNNDGLKNYSQGIDNITKSLSGLSKLKFDIPNLGKISSDLESLTGLDFNKISQSGDSIKHLSDGLFSLKGLENIDLSGIDSNKIKDISNAASKLKDVKVPDLTPLAQNLADLSKVNLKDNGINNTINAIKRLSTAKIGMINPIKIAMIGNSLKSLSQVSDVSPTLNRLVSSFARLANAGEKTGKSASGIANLGIQVRKTITNLSGVGEISESLNLFVQSVGRLASAGGKVGETASGLKSLAIETRSFFDVMKDAPKVSENTIRMTEALAQLASAGGKVGSSTNTINRSILGMSKSGGIAKASFNVLVKTAKFAANQIVKLAGKISSAFKSIISSSRGLNRASLNLGTLLKTAIGFRLGYGLLNFGRSAIELGSDITEVQNVVDVAFGSMSGMVEDFANTSIENFGLSKTAAKEYSGILMSMFKSSGFNSSEMRQQAAEMSIALTGLAGDLASFYNIRTEDAFYKLRATMAGEIEPMRQLGVNMNIANLEAYALANGINKSYQSMSQAEQQLLRYNYLMAVTGAQQGDFARTSGSWANQTRILAENFRYLSSVLGQGLIAAILPGIQALNALMGKLIQVAETFRNFVYTLMGKKIEGSQGGIVNDLAGIGDTSSGLENLGAAGGDAASGMEDATGAAHDLKKALSVLSFDELNQLSESASAAGGALGGIGGGGGLDNIQTPTFGGLSNALDDAINNGENFVSLFAHRIRKAIKSENWQALGIVLANELNKGLQKVYDVISWKNVGPKITAFTTAFTETFNSLVTHFNWDLLGRTVGTGVNTIVNTLNQLADGIDWINLGSKMAEGFNGLFDEVDWNNLGHLIGNKFRIAWDMFAGFVKNLDYADIGRSIAEFLTSAFGTVSFGNVGTALSNLMDGAFESLRTFTKEFEWNDFANNVAEGISNFLKNTEWKENGAALGEFLTKLGSALKGAITNDTFYDLGKGIGEFIGALPWLDLLKGAAEFIIGGLSSAFDGLSESGTAGAIASFIGKAFIAVKVADITGIGSLVGKIISHFVKKFETAEKIQQLSDALGKTLSSSADAASTAIDVAETAAGTAAKGGFKSLLSAIGASGAGIGLIAVLPVATSMLAKFVEKLMGGNGKLSTMGASINDLAGKLQQLGTLSKDQAEEVWSLVDAWENEGLSAQEMATKLMEKFSEWGLSTDAVNTVLQDNNYWTAQVKDNVDLLTESAGQLGEGFSRTAEQIDLSGVSMKDAMGGMRDALYELSLSGGEFSGTYQGILMSMDDTLASSKTAQEALNMLAGQLEAAGIPADQFISKLQERFPEATMAVKSSVDTNIAGAQQTMTTEMGKADKAVSDSTSSMKKNAENNLAGVKSAAELSASGVSDTTILSWGNSAREVTLKLREMKLAASTELGNMTETVRSFSESMYNIMTKKFEYLASKIKQIISAMSKDTKSVFSSMLSGLSESTQKATNRIVNIFSRIPREISSSLGDNMYYAGRNAAVSFANGISSVHIPMPHISVDANTWSNGNGYSYRMSSSVNWYKSGGLFGVPSVIGVGEAGKEAVLPLENKRTMSMIADSIMSRAPQDSLDQQTIENAVAKGVAMAMMNNQQNPINVTCYAELKTEDNEVLARAVTKGQKSIDRRLHPTLQFGY